MKSKTFVLTSELLTDVHFNQWLPTQPMMDIVFDFHCFQQSVPTSESFVVRMRVNSIYITTVASD